MSLIQINDFTTHLGLGRATGGIGLINGALTGAFSSFVLSFGNATVEGKGFGQSLEAGISGIAPGLLLGGIAGVAAARVAGLNLINGKPLLGTIAVRAPNIFDYKQTATRTEEVVAEDVIAEVKDETVNQVSKETEQVLSNESIEVLPEVYSNKLNSVTLTKSEINYAVNNVQNIDDFISSHAYVRHKFDPSRVSSRSKTQYGQGIDVSEIRNQTIHNADAIVHHYDAPNWSKFSESVTSTYHEESILLSNKNLDICFKTAFNFYLWAESMYFMILVVCIL
jgi:hypothetical protein